MDPSGVTHIEFFLGNTAIFAGIATALTGLIVYFRESRHPAVLAYLFLSASFAAWSVTIGILFGSSLSPFDQMVALLTFFTSTFMPFTLFCFAATLSVSDPQHRHRAIIWASIPMAFLLLTGFVPEYQFDNVAAYSGLGKQIIYGPGVIYHVIFVVGYVGMAAYLFWQLYREHAGVFRFRFRYILVIPIATTIILLITDLLFPRIGIPDLLWVGPVALFIGNLSLGYMFIRLRLWNIKLIGTEFFTAMVILALVFDTIYADLYFEFVLKFTITVLVLLASIFLIRSVRREIAAKEEVKHLLDDLSDAHRKLQIIDRNKSEFIESASRNLRDPLLAIQGYASLFLEGAFKTGNKEVHGAIRKTHDSAKRLLAIIDDFMNVSRIETGEMEYEHTAFDLKDELVDVVEEMRIHAEEKGLTLSFEAEPDDDHTLTADPGKLRQVFSNLIDNAIKYTREGSITVTIDTDTKNTGIDGIHVSVSDTGIGMEDKTLRKIFKKFSRAENVAKLSTEGSGLGLYVARRIVEDHGGNIWAESEGKEQGSTFHVVVPWEKGEQ